MLKFLQHICSLASYTHKYVYMCCY